MKNPKLSITTKDIRELASPSIYQRGSAYCRAGAIRTMKQHGYSLSGTCLGSEGNLYKIRVDFNTEDIIEATCTCPYDWGICKHIVAFLLTYIEKPQLVEQQQSAETLLANATPEQLIYYIQKILQQYPDAYAILEQPVPSETSVLSPQDIQKLQEDLYDGLSGEHFEFSYDYYDHGYGDYGQTQERIDALFDKIALARQFADKRNWKASHQIIEATLATLIEVGSDYDLFEDESFAEPTEQMATFLSECLAMPAVRDNNEERVRFLDSLITIFDLSTDAGWYTMVVENAIVTSAQPADLAKLRNSIELFMTGADKSGSAEACARLLARLDPIDNTDPEITLQRLKQGGFHHLLQEKLIDLGRIDEAVALFQDNRLNNKQNIARAISIFEQKGYIKQAVQVAENYLSTQHDEPIALTLKRLYQLQGNTKGSLNITLQLFNQKPTLQTYNDIKSLATAIHEWDTVRASVIQQVIESGDLRFLIRIYLQDAEYDTAIELFREIPRPINPSYDWINFEWEVAQAVRFEYPTIALPFYLEKVHQIISARNRSAYTDAIKLLKEVRRIYEVDDEITAFHKLVNDLKDQYKTLRAFHDELKKARL